MTQTSDFPQADRLVQVGAVAIAISKGNHSDTAIESAIGLNSIGRQGRYYRQAAETLGLVKNSQNHAELTPLGMEYATLTSDASRMDFLARCLLETEVFQEALQYIQSSKPDYSQLRAWFVNFFPGATSTAERRFSTFFAYLSDTKLLALAGGSYVVQKYLGAVVKNKINANVGLTGKTVTKTQGNAPAANSAGVLTFQVSEQKRERANQSHWKLVAAKSAFLHAKGIVPKENPCIDLFGSVGNNVILYEMKSAEVSNLQAQARKAIAQLYEYRYIYKEPSASLCIVTNLRVPKADSWLLEYLAKDRKIAYEWTEDFEQFQCDSDSQSLLGAFAP